MLIGVEDRIGFIWYWRWIRLEDFLYFFDDVRERFCGGSFGFIIFIFVVGIFKVWIVVGFLVWDWGSEEEMEKMRKEKRVKKRLIVGEDIVESVREERVVKWRYKGEERMRGKLVVVSCSVFVLLCVYFLFVVFFDWY